MNDDAMYRLTEKGRRALAELVAQLAPLLRADCFEGLDEDKDLRLALAGAAVGLGVREDVLKTQVELLWAGRDLLDQIASGELR